VAIKADVRLLNTGDENSALFAHSGQLPYKTSNTFLNIGIGYSF
jgi:hypothetical protein